MTLMSRLTIVILSHCKFILLNFFLSAKEFLSVRFLKLMLARRSDISMDLDANLLRH
jgi:hypothetical protein